MAISILKLLKDDYKKSNLNIFKLIVGAFVFLNFWLVVLYRFANWIKKCHVPYISEVLMIIGKIIYSAEIDPSSNIGPGFQIVHSVGVVIGPKVVAGKDFRIHQNVTIGMRERQYEGRITPVIGDNVTVYAGAVVLGPIIIGDNVTIGANSVVINDVPSNVIVAGIPAKVVKKKNSL